MNAIATDSMTRELFFAFLHIFAPNKNCPRDRHKYYPRGSMRLMSHEAASFKFEPNSLKKHTVLNFS